MPTFSLSPGTTIVEKDLVSVISKVGQTAAGFAGAFQWGPVDELVRIDTPNQLVDVFGEPNTETYKHFFTAENFLQYASNLQVNRVVTSAANNAVAGSLDYQLVENSSSSSSASGESESSSSSGSQSSSSSSSSGSLEGVGDLLIKNKIDYIDNYLGTNTAGAATSGKFGMWAAKYPGALGNSLKVAWCDGSTAFATWKYASNFSDVNLGTSTYVSDRGGANDELHVIVIDEDGLWTGTAGTVLETFPFLSKASDAKKPDGTSNFYKTVLNEKSKYIWWLNHPTAAQGHTAANSGAWGSTASNTSFQICTDSVGDVERTSATNNSQFTSVSLRGGADGNSITSTQLATTEGFGKFNDALTVDVNLILGGPADATTAAYLVNTVALGRKDCVVLLSPEESDVVNVSSEASNITTFSDTLASTSYIAIDSGWKYQYDRYNDTYRYVPLNGDIGGLCAKTDDTHGSWFSPAGKNRGQIKNVVRLAYNPVKADRDTLYKKGVNPVVTIPGQGTFLFGDKTHLTKPSAFDRLSIRRLFITLEKSITISANSALFDVNDENSRAAFRSAVEPFLRRIRGAGGIKDYQVVCDASNNTADVIALGNFVADIFIKPLDPAVNAIRLNFVATGPDVNFTEIGS